MRWLFATLLFAGVCAYLALCLLFYQGQWQVIFQPSSSITTTPATLGIPFDEVRFDYTETGVSQLDGWWIPAETAPAKQPSLTILFLHDGRGSLSDVAAQLKTLHSLPVNIFAIDYRGFGRSLNTHPSEQRVYQDADAAMSYLIDSRHVDPRSIVVYGVGLGATIAAEAVRRHPDSAGLVVEQPAPPALTLISIDTRTRLLPVRLLFRDRFELAPRLQDLKVPKLFLVRTGTNNPEKDRGANSNYFPAASEPKTIVSLPGISEAGKSSPSADPEYLPAVHGFLDQVRPQTR